MRSSEAGVEMKRWIIGLCCLAGAAGLTACKTAVIGMQQHPSFTYEATMHSRVLVGGVVSALTKRDRVTRQRDAELMARMFAEERPGLSQLRSGHLAQALGPDAYQRMLDEYRATGLIDAEAAQRIRQAFPDIRYLMLARIERNHVTREHQQSETDVADSAEDAKKGEYEQVRVDVSLTTRREMGATLTIYDLQQQLPAWSGYVNGSESVSNDSSRTFDKDKRWSQVSMRSSMR